MHDDLFLRNDIEHEMMPRCQFPSENCHRFQEKRRGPKFESGNDKHCLSTYGTDAKYEQKWPCHSFCLRKTWKMTSYEIAWMTRWQYGRRHFLDPGLVSLPSDPRNYRKEGTSQVLANLVHKSSLNWAIGKTRITSRTVVIQSRKRQQLYKQDDEKQLRGNWNENRSMSTFGFGCHGKRWNETKRMGSLQICVTPVKLIGILSEMWSPRTLSRFDRGLLFSFFLARKEMRIFKRGIPKIEPTTKSGSPEKNRRDTDNARKRDSRAGK